ncbi:fatty acid desaturase-domain-containing protein [Roridomyces roridus]|uniref:Fatty acid desaturase-domain-containing protein n=1 Tax=Roridomyces roridus TaxID=1738132 RepID=A0AAD7BS10_9AGAR|nr:fatty acid desaturase-domain-containing protein [Roridomyces roridus]
MAEKTTTQTASYNEEDLPTYAPMEWTLKEIRSAIPARLFERHTGRAVLYLARDIVVAGAFWALATNIDPLSSSLREQLTPVGAQVFKWSAWMVYWWFQSLAFTGLWVIGHECGHSAFSAHSSVNDTIGFILHSALFTPFFSWKYSHHRHHSNHASMERDEVYVPQTRSDLGLPQEPVHDESIYEELLGDTPIYTLYMLIRQQVLAFPAYLLFNVSGQKHYPKWTNHFDPSSIIFNKNQRNAVIMSNIGLLSMIALLVVSGQVWSSAAVVKYYLIPWIGVTHWFILITYLHHTDPTLPHYRGPEWNFQRGAAATVDRPVLGWQGRFFLHDVAHFHVIHHFFPMMPWYHGEEATQHLKAFIGPHYAWSDKPIFSALWDSYNRCQFVEDSGNVLFYRDKHGHAVRRPAPPKKVEPMPMPSATADSLCL